MKTIQQHLQSLPEPHRTNAKCMDISMSHVKVENQCDAIFLGIDWNSSPGMDYWEQLHDDCAEGRIVNG